jgi:hypothetical protein
VQGPELKPPYCKKESKTMLCFILEYNDFILEYNDLNIIVLVIFFYVYSASQRFILVILVFSFEKENSVHKHTG